MKNKVVIVSIAAAVIVIAFIIGAMKFRDNKAEKVAELVGNNQTTLVPDHAARMGATNAKVTLVEFLDPECESCRHFYPIVKMFMSEYEGKIQLVIRYAPFHPNSRFAVKIIEAARKQGKYWETLELLFQHQPEWGSHHEPKPELIWNYLPQLGLDIDRLKSDMLDPQIEELIAKDIQDGQALGVQKTPSFFVNGKPLETFGVEPLRTLIQSEL